MECNQEYDLPALRSLRWNALKPIYDRRAIIAVRSVKFTNKGQMNGKLNQRDVKYFTFNSFKDILSDNDINTIDTNAKTKTEDMGSMTRATKMSFCPLTVLCITEWEEM